MKKLLLSVTVLLVTMFGLHSCVSDCTQTVYYTAKRPFYGNLAGIRDSVFMQAPRAFGNIVKIAEGNKVICLLDKNKGVHIVDYSDKDNPELITFIEIAHILDMDVKDNYLYIVQASDLLTINLSNPNTPVVESRNVNVLNSLFVKADSFVVGYRNEEVVTTIENTRCADEDVRSQPFREDELTLETEPYAAIEATNQHLHIVDNSVVITLNITTPNQPRFTATNTLFNINPKPDISANSSELFVGSPNFISEFNISNNPNTPILTTSFWGGNSCGAFHAHSRALVIPEFFTGNVNEQQVCISSTNVTLVSVNSTGSIRVRQVFPFSRPISASSFGEFLVLCEGKSGFRLFDLTEIATLSLPLLEKDRVQTVEAQLSILRGNNLYVWGNNELTLFNISNSEDVQFVSKL